MSRDRGSRARFDGDRGAILVEAAFVLPVLMLLVLGLADLANLSLQSSQAGSAARDGARTAILHYQCADSTAGTCSTSNDSKTIAKAVNDRLPGRAGVTVTVRCIDGASASLASEPCTGASVDDDLVEVTVSWPMKALSFVGGSFTPSRISATSRMAIVGSPLTLPTTTSTSSTSSTSTTSTTSTSTIPTTTTTTATPTTCGVSSIQLASQPQSQGSHFNNPLVITVTTNGAPNCVGATWALAVSTKPIAASLSASYSPPSPRPDPFSFTIPDTAGWAKGSYQFTLMLDGTAVGTIPVTVS